MAEFYRLVRAWLGGDPLARAAARDWLEEHGEPDPDAVLRYLADTWSRIYRDHGGGAAGEWVTHTLGRLSRGG